MVVEYKQFVYALMNTGKSKVDADAIADRVLNHFGFRQEIIDNQINNEERDLFYMLEEEEILTTRNEPRPEISPNYRLYYWILNENKIDELANKKEDSTLPKENQFECYNNIPDDVWVR